MGVQYGGAVAARGAVHFSTTGNSTGSKRAPDLVLQPAKEGVDFTLRLLQANRMSKVVEINIDIDAKGNANAFTKAKQQQPLTKHDINSLFRAIGGSENYEEEEDDDDDKDVADEYHPTDSDFYSGLPQLESLSITINNSNEDATSSFLEPLIAFLSASGSFPRFTRLSLQGVNLRGGILEFKGLAEAFRLHPHIQNVHMVGCWFTPEQKENMDCLEAVFQEQQRRSSAASTMDSKRASILHMKQLVLEHAGDIKVEDEKQIETPTGKTNLQKMLSQADEPTQEAPWLERLLKSCFCGFW